MAPEGLSRKNGRPAFASDVFSVGIILWEMQAKQRVHSGFLNMDENTVWDEETKQHRVDVKLVAKRMASGGQRPEVPVDCPVLWSLLMQACWEAAIDARPTFPQVLTVLKAMATVPTWAEPTDIVRDAAPRPKGPLKGALSAAECCCCWQRNTELAGATCRHRDPDPTCQQVPL